jgi:hypothetical protein
MIAQTTTKTVARGPLIAGMKMTNKDVLGRLVVLRTKRTSRMARRLFLSVVVTNQAHNQHPSRARATRINRPALSVDLAL